MANDPKSVALAYIEGCGNKRWDEVCVLYDFVTDTPAGAVPAVEWLRVEGGRIARIQLVFDRVAFKPAADELARRAQK